MHTQSTYNEAGVSFDVSESGAGLRTLLALAANVELSRAPILLLDEPDAHLHASVQRQLSEFLSTASDSSKQLLVATHAPEMIEQFPLESLRWIDRQKRQSETPNDISIALVQLGAATHRQVFQILNAKAFVYFEDEIDRKVFEAVIKSCGNDFLLETCATATLQGFGDATYLDHVSRFISQHHGKKVPMAAILDGDYNPLGKSDQKTGDFVIIERLPFKELENLPLLYPQCLATRSTQSLREREGNSIAEVTLAEVKELIDAATAAAEVTEMVRSNWIVKRLPEKPDAGQLRKIEGQFGELWKDPVFRRTHSPGKKILRTVKAALQRKYAISFTTTALFEEFDPPQSLRELFQRVEDHVRKNLTV